MKTLSEIEKAAEKLSSERKQELIEFLSAPVQRESKLQPTEISLQPNAPPIWNAGPPAMSPAPACPTPLSAATPFD
jgi:hypothetical protein